MTVLRKYPWLVPAVVVAIAATLMWLILGFSSGYGQVIDGEVKFFRKPLIFHIQQDYRRDGGEWSFGYFVPMAVGALFWFRRKELLATGVKLSLWSGGAVLVFALLIYFAGYRGEQKYFGYAAGQFFVAGAILWFLGWAWMRKVFWLWMLLGMMWPWRFLIERISSPLQLIMIKLTSGFMDVIGVDAYAHGSQLRTGTPDPVTGKAIMLDVDVECSGMRSLFALVMIGLVFAFLRVKDEWKRWVVMACVPVVAILGNFVRMMMLYWGSAAFGTDFAIGEGHKNISAYHIGAGLAVFVVALLVLSSLTYFLEKGSGGFRAPKVVTRKMGEIQEEN